MLGPSPACPPSLPFWTAWIAGAAPWSGGFLASAGMAEPKDPSAWWTSLHPEDWPTFRLPLMDRLAGRPGDGRLLMFRWRDGQGAWRWMQAQLAEAPAAWGHGWAGRILVGAVDAHGLGHDRQAELEASHFKQAIDHLPVMVCAFDAQDRLVYWNRESERMVGWTAEEFLKGATFINPMEAIYPDPAYRAWVMETRARLGRSFRDLEFELTRRNGETRTIAWSNISGEVPIPGWEAWSVGVDVTDRVRAQEALHHLLLGVAHEGRNPLFAISSIVDAVQARLPEGDSFRGYTRALSVEVARLKSLMDDLVSFGKPLSLQRRPVPVRELVEGAAAACAAGFEALGVVLRMTGLEGAECPSVDPCRTHQILRNLLENAAQHAARGGRSVEAACRTENGTWICSILDDGPGIAPADLPQLFEPLFSKRGGGLGLGLAIARRFAEAHQGTLRAFNRATGGAGFELVLPLAIEAPAGASQSEPNRNLETSESSIPGSGTSRT